MPVPNLFITVKKQRKSDVCPIYVTFNQLLCQNAALDEESKLLISAEITNKINSYLSVQTISTETASKRKNELKLLFLHKEMQCIKVNCIHNNVKVKEFYLYIIWEKIEEHICQLFQQFAQLFDINIAFNNEHIIGNIARIIRPYKIIRFEDKNGYACNSMENFKRERIIRVLCELKKLNKAVLSHVVSPKYSHSINSKAINYTNFYNTINISNKIRSLYQCRSPALSTLDMKKAKLLYASGSSICSTRLQSDILLAGCKVHQNVRSFSESGIRKAPISLVNLCPIDMETQIVSKKASHKTMWISPYLIRAKQSEMKAKSSIVSNAQIYCHKCKLNTLN